MNYAVAQEFKTQETNLGVIGEYGESIFIGGGGISFADFNNDGFDDLTFATEANENVIFYENKKGHFELVDPPFITNLDESKQIVWVDFDDDGDKDLFVSTFDATDRLYENDGNMNFVDVTSSIGLSMSETDTYSINFGDLNMYGNLELYIARYGEDILGDTNSLYTYNTTTKYFDCVTNLSGVSNGFQESLATSFFDFDNDGDLDIYVSNDRIEMPNSLYMNIGNMSFVDVSVPSQSNAAIWAMNAAVGDYNMDGWMDIYVTNIGDAVLYENNQNNTFSDVAPGNNVTLDRYCWAGNFFDFDNDKDLDLYVCTQSSNFDEPNAFLVNDDGLSFSEPYNSTGGLNGEDFEASFVNAYGDLDNNGKHDFVVSKKLGSSFDVWVNYTENGNNFIKLDLIGKDSHSEAFGAVVETWIDGEKTINQKHCTQGYQSQHSSYMIIGLGQDETIDSLVIKWPYAGSEEMILGSSLLINGMNQIEEKFGLLNSFYQNICHSLNYAIVLDPVPSQTYGSAKELSCSTAIDSLSQVTFNSEEKICLDVGFEVKLGAEFLAEINNCEN